MTTKYKLFSICLLLSWGLPAIAQSPGGDEEALLLLYGNEEMISIATGNRQPISKAPAVATVITDKDIKAMGATDLDEVLEAVPGLHVARSHSGYNPIYTIRGIYSEFNPEVLLLINGIPITNLFHGDRSQVWGGMPVEAIARVEVIRGPGSAIYGADAFAGVVNISTKSADDIDGIEAGARVGSFGTKDAWGLFGGKAGGFDVAFMLEYHETDGHREIITADMQTALDDDPLISTDASLAPGPVNLQRENLDARIDVSRGNWTARAGLQRRGNVGNGAGVAQALDPNNRFASDRWNADLTYRRELGDSWDVSAQLSYLDVSQEVERDLLLFPPGAKLPIGDDGNINGPNPTLVDFPDGVIGNPEVFERHYRLDLSAFFLGHAKHNWRFGAGAYYGDLYKVRETKNYGPGVLTGTETTVTAEDVVDVSGTPFVFLPEDDRTNHYLTVQDVWNFANDWELTTGVRYDDYSDFGDTVNPRVALVWSAHHNLTTKLLYGRAFRAPSFAETRKQNNPVARGNPDLKPEEIETIEWAFDYRPTERLQLGLNLFRYWWDDIIVFVPDAGGTTAANAGEQTGHGAELELTWQASHDLKYAANYAFQEATDETTGDPAGNSPNHQVYARAEWNFLPHWSVIPQANWVGERKRQSGDPREPLDAYTWVDLTLRTTSLGRNTEAALSVRNVFDVDAREPSLHGINGAAIQKDLPLAGRSIYGELRYRF